MPLQHLRALLVKFSTGLASLTHSLKIYTVGAEEDFSVSNSFADVIVGNPCRRGNRKEEANCVSFFKTIRFEKGIRRL